MTESEYETELDALQYQIDTLETFQEMVCSALTPEGDQGPLFPEMVQARINELRMIEATAPTKTVQAAYQATLQRGQS